jgi:hypothetical protein
MWLRHVRHEKIRWQCREGSDCRKELSLGADMTQIYLKVVPAPLIDPLTHFERAVNLT